MRSDIVARSGSGKPAAVVFPVPLSRGRLALPADRPITLRWRCSARAVVEAGRCAAAAISVAELPRFVIIHGKYVTKLVSDDRLSPSGGKVSIVRRDCV